MPALSDHEDSDLEDCLLPDGSTIRAHRRDRCQPPCALHAPSDHHMRGWPLVFREHGGLERTCPHGIGHPDPDSVAWIARNAPEYDAYFAAHGCDDCCRPKEA